LANLSGLPNFYERSLQALTHPAGYVGSQNLELAARSKGTAASSRHNIHLLIEM
jgi:hypothetical protein